MHLTPIVRNRTKQHHTAPCPLGIKISPSPTRWLCFPTCSTSLTQSCRGLLGKIAHVLLCDWSAIAYFRIPSFPQSCNFLPAAADADTSSWSGCAAAGRSWTEDSRREHRAGPNVTCSKIHNHTPANQVRCCYIHARAYAAELMSSHTESDDRRLPKTTKRTTSTRQRKWSSRGRVAVVN